MEELDYKEQFEKETGNDPWMQDDKTGTMLLTQDYAEWIESKLNNNEVLGDVSCSDYRAELITKLDSMKNTANEMFTEDGARTANAVLDNVKVNEAKIHKKHYS